MRQGGVMKIADAEAFGNELRTRRKELGYTQAYIAEFTGFSVSFISVSYTHLDVYKRQEQERNGELLWRE